MIPRQRVELFGLTTERSAVLRFAGRPDVCGNELLQKFCLIRPRMMVHARCSFCGGERIGDVLLYEQRETAGTFFRHGIVFSTSVHLTCCFKIKKRKVTADIRVGSLPLLIKLLTVVLRFQICNEEGLPLGTFQANNRQNCKRKQSDTIDKMEIIDSHK